MKSSKKKPATHKSTQTGKKHCWRFLSKWDNGFMFCRSLIDPNGITSIHTTQSYTTAAAASSDSNSTKSIVVFKYKMWLIECLRLDRVIICTANESQSTNGTCDILRFNQFPLWNSEKLLRYWTSFELVTTLDGMRKNYKMNRCVNECDKLIHLRKW